MFRAEEYYRLDSVNLALNGDGQNLGFVKIVDKFGGTKAGKLASFYAGSCYLKLNDYEKAVKYLKNSAVVPTWYRQEHTNSWVMLMLIGERMMRH